MNETEAAVLYPSGCILGESPMWHSERNSCFWVDIEQCIISEYNILNGSYFYYQLTQRVSLAVKTNNANQLIVGLQGGVGRFDLITKALSVIATDFDVDWKDYRCNDGGCDNKNRLWISTTELNHKNEAGSLYCIDENMLISKKMDKLSISNGMAWSRDNKKLYHTDSATREIRSYLYDEQSGNLEFEKVVVIIPEKDGVPDGIVMDAEGKLWVALWGGFGVGRFDIESGKMISFIKIPAPNVSSCAFVGKALDKLMITTARKGMSENNLIDFPESGHIFIIEPGVTGVPVFNCAL